MTMPKIDAANLKKPLCYDPKRDRFIYYDDIVSGRERIIPLESLSNADLKKLIIERHRAGPDYRVRAITGPEMSRDEVVKAIERGDPFGQITIEAETAYLQEFLADIERNLK